MGKVKFYAVAKGRRIGVFGTWKECQEQTSGFSGAVFKSFPTRDLAQTYINSHKDDTTKKRKATAALTMPLPPVSDKNDNDDINDTNNKRRRIIPEDTTVVGDLLSIHLSFDGGSRGNPGISGAGAYIIVQSKHKNDTNDEHVESQTRIREFCGTSKTNNFAEYTGLMIGLQQVKKIIHQSLEERIKNKTSSMTIHISVKGDSELIKRQMNGECKVKSDNLRPLFQQCIHLRNEIKQMNQTIYKGKIFIHNLKWDHSHVYRKDNKEADSLANEAMDTRKSWITTSEYCNV